MQRTRTRYDSFLVMLCSEGKDHLIPDDIKNNIPRSTLFDWKNTHLNDFYGNSLRPQKEQVLKFAEINMQRKHLAKVLHIIARVWIAISDHITPILSNNRKLDELFINQIQLLFRVFDKKNTVFKIAGISPASLCLKRHPLQLAVSEVNKIKSLFDIPEYSLWPSSSLYFAGLRNHGLYIAQSTFYKYVNLLGLKRKPLKKTKKTKGIVSQTPNEYLHVDTTFWEINPFEKVAGAIVSDNFSRHILGWSVSMHNKAENVKLALQKALDTIKTHYPELTCCNLVADGGSENHAVTVTELIESGKQPDINKLIARKHIKFSNSAVEAVIKIIKQYLRAEKPTTEEGVTACVHQAVMDYTEKRPHGSLNGLTPLEAYKHPGKKLNYTAQILQAKGIRIYENQKVNCAVCL